MSSADHDNVSKDPAELITDQSAALSRIVQAGTYAGAKILHN